jgi:UDP-2,3-diacylglucosamine pyrophosphatase LpxH
MELTYESAKVRHQIATDKSANVQPDAPRHYRALFISDVHLGTKGCQAGRLLEFLRHHDADSIYLVGDIVDGWQLKNGWYWPQAHNDVLQKFLRRARKGTRLVYVPGNHDEFLRSYFGVHFGGIEVVGETVHVAADGRRYLVTHGDQFDMVVKHARWLAPLGDHAYALSVASNKSTNWVRRRFGLSAWSLSKWAKQKVKNAVNYTGEFEHALAAQARRHSCDGVICGHIHHPANREIGGARYVNCGDWVENCTVAVEKHDGQFEILSWAQSSAPVVADRARAA